MMDEESLLGSYSAEHYESDIKDIVKDTLNGEYENCITKCLVKFPYLKMLLVQQQVANETLITSNAKDFESTETFEQLLCCAISSLQLFVQINWTGPLISENFFPELLSGVEPNKLISSLELDGESVYIGTKQLPLFALSFRLFSELFEGTHSLSSCWWYLRCVSIYQQLLQERSPTLMKISERCLASIFDNFYSVIKSASMKVQLNLEAGLISLFYYKYEKANEYFIAATSNAGIECKLTGDLGVRTKFQQKPVSQLRVEISKTCDFTSSIPVNDNIPVAMKLNNETLLETVKFTSDNIAENPKLTPEQQAVLLAYCNHMSKIKPSQAMDKEEIKAVISVILLNPQCWSVQVEALKIRSLLENDRTKTVERSMMQMESLVNNVREVKNMPPMQNKRRLDLIYSVQINPIWNLEKQLSKLYSSLGAHSSALEIYMRLKMWDDAILCLILTGRGEEAKKLIYEQLKINETPTLWCLLGDILMDISAYEKAWDISNHRSARAMRSLGAYYVSKKNHARATECFEKSLEVNELQVGVCFNLGCAYMVMQDYKKAIRAFKRCTTLNWDNFEAWNNLSAAFIHSGEKDKAFRTLQDAIKCQYNKWQIWENYIPVCADTGNFQECIRAYDVLLNLKEKFLDIEILSILVQVITKKIPSSNGIVDNRLKSKVLELFGKVTSKTPNEWKIWELYAKLIGNGMDKDEDDLINSKALGYLQKALKYATSAAWEKNHKHVKKVFDLSKLLCEAIEFLLDNKVMAVETLKPMMATIRLNINGIISTLRMHEQRLIDAEAIDETNNMIELMENKIKSRFNKLWSSVI